MKTIFVAFFSLIMTNCFSQKMANHITIKRYHSTCIIDVNNIELIPSGHYSHIWTAYDTSGKYFVVTDFKGRKGIYKLGEKEIVPCIYDDILTFKNHGFVTKGNNWAVISNEYKIVSDYIFEEVSHFNEDGFSLVKKNGQWISIDMNGNIVKYLPYEEVISFNEDEVYKKAGQNKKYGFIDRDYNVIIPFEYENVGTAINGMNDLFPVQKDGKWGYVNKKNKVVVPFKYSYVTPFYKGFGMIKNHNHNTIGVVAPNGKVLFDDGRYVDIEVSDEGMFIYTVKDSISRKNLKGYLDCKTLQVLTKPQFEVCENFNNGRAIVKKDGLYGIIDKSGTVVIPFLYDYINCWLDKYLVTLKGKNGMIDKSGEIIVPIAYDSYTYNGLHATIIKNGFKGILNNRGDVLISPIYDNIEAVSDEVFYATKKDVKYLLYLNGTEKIIE